MPDLAAGAPHPPTDHSADDALDGMPPWQRTLPVLSSGNVVLREVQHADAAALAVLLSDPRITRYISPPPETVDGFESFIAASQHARARGEGACFAVTLRDHEAPVGLLQVRVTSRRCADQGGVAARGDVAEWGFALGIPFWGTGVFPISAALLLEFVFEQMGAHRLEARCVLKNGRGGRALMKVGAVAEGVLRKAFLCGDTHLDQVLYAIVADDWQMCRDRCHSVAGSIVH